MLLRIRGFYVSLQGTNGKWMRQNNGLLQGSVLVPMIFNVYKNDHPRDIETKHFLYTYDLAVATRG